MQWNCYVEKHVLQTLIQDTAFFGTKIIYSLKYGFCAHLFEKKNQTLVLDHKYKLSNDDTGF